MKKFFVFVLFGFLSVSLFSCFLFKKDYSLTEDLVDLKSNTSFSNIVSDFSVRTKLHDKDLKWKSSNEDILTIQNGEVSVKRGEENQTVYITVSFLENENKFKSFELIVLGAKTEIEAPKPAWYKERSIPYDYYSGVINTLSDEEFIKVLRQRINLNFVKKSYNDARYILDKTDVHFENQNKIWGIYDNILFENKWDSGKTWNREHVWPNSWLGIERVKGTSKNIGTDLHNLRACGKGTNSSRSNRFYTEGSGSNITVGEYKYYPGDNHKGDVARILLYMVVKYEQLGLSSSKKGETYKLSGAFMGDVNTLYKWHKEDPVDHFEINRNEVIFSFQKNRNPFIDHPEWYEKVWTYYKSLSN